LDIVFRKRQTIYLSCSNPVSATSKGRVMPNALVISGASPSSPLIALCSHSVPSMDSTSGLPHYCRTAIPCFEMYKRRPKT
jgi:hypothetical protein